MVLLLVLVQQIMTKPIMLVLDLIFTDHPPLILPCDGFRLRLSEPVLDDTLHRQLVRLRRFLWELERESLPANQRAVYGLDPSQ
ncbi:hypothetical protein Chor_009403 [Crotalus horridus]